MAIRAFIIPAALLAATAAYIAISPASPSVGEVGDETPEAAATPTAAPDDRLPDGVSGLLSYSSKGQYVTVRFPNMPDAPDAVELSRVSDGPEKGDVWSADGAWRLHGGFDQYQTYAYTMVAEDGRAVTPPQGEGYAWAPGGHRYAVKLYSGTEQSIIVGDPETGVVQEVASQSGIFGFAWDANGEAIIAATADERGWNLTSFALDGTRSTLVELQALPGYLYRPPAGDRYAFTASGDNGWRMMLYEGAAGTVRDLGPMGSDGPDGQPVTVPPDQKGPLYIAWSPDGSKLAFGGGIEPPYLMRIVDVGSGMVQTTEFAEGYPGEIFWTNDGARIGVSTYDKERKRHEVYVVDPATGVARHVTSGCIILWSPDGRFIAVHGAGEPGIAIADVETLESGRLTYDRRDFPIRWVE